jgi:hypothetical protein
MLMRLITLETIDDEEGVAHMLSSKKPKIFGSIPD